MTGRRIGRILAAAGLLAASSASAQVFEVANQTPDQSAVAVRCVNAAGGAFVECGIGGAGTTDTDDGSIAGGQSLGLGAALAHVWSGAAWLRLTQGQATMAASVPVVVASDQTAIPIGINYATTTTGSITANGQSVTAAVAGLGVVTIEITNTFSGQLEFEADTGDGGYSNVTLSAPNVGTPATGTAGTGKFTGAVGGLANIRVRASSWTSGTADIRIYLTHIGNPNALIVGVRDGFVRIWSGGSVALVSPAGGGSLQTETTSFPDNEPFDVSRWGGAPADAAAALQDNYGNPTVPPIGAFAMFWDGSAWDRWTGAVTATNLDIRDLSSASDSVTTIFSQAGTANDVDVLSLPNEGQQTAANSTSVTPDTDNDPIGTPGAAAPGEAVQIAGVVNGNLVVPHVDPCDREARDSFVVNISTASTTQIAAAVSGEFYFICSITLQTDAANDVAFVEDDTSACASPTAGLVGGTTTATGFNFPASGGIALGATGRYHYRSATANRFICLITSVGTQLTGNITYVSTTTP